MTRSFRDATIRAAAVRGGQVDGRPAIEKCDLHRKERAGRTGTLILFVVDASGSMAARRRMELVKGAVLGLLESAYEQRDEVSVIAYNGGLSMNLDGRLDVCKPVGDLVVDLLLNVPKSRNVDEH